MGTLKAAIIYDPSRIKEREMKAALSGLREFSRFGLESEAIDSANWSLLRVKRSGILAEATKSSQMHLRPSDLFRPRDWEIATGLFFNRDRLGIAITDSILFSRDESMVKAVREFSEGSRQELGMGFSLEHLESAGARAARFRLEGHGRQKEIVLSAGGEAIPVKSKEMGGQSAPVKPGAEEEEYSIGLLFLERNDEDAIVIHSEIERRPQRKEERALGLSAQGAGGIVSISRLREVCHNSQLADAIKLAVMHEMGHVLGRKDHCANDGCLMQENRDHLDFIENFVEKGRKICWECSGMIASGVSRLASDF